MQYIKDDEVLLDSEVTLSGSDLLNFLNGGGDMTLTENMIIDLAIELSKNQEPNIMRKAIERACNEKKIEDYFSQEYYAQNQYLRRRKEDIEKLNKLPKHELILTDETIKKIREVK
jgi:hypothetical protein